MQNMNFIWLYSVPWFLYLVFYVAAIVFLIVKRRQNPAGATWAILGISMLLFFHVASWLVTAVLQRTFDQDSYIIFNGLNIVLTTIARVGAYCMILAAVFVGQRSVQLGADGANSPGAFPASSDNPYVPPISR